MLLSQSQRIRRSGFNPEIIVGVSRGGWIPARVLSDLLQNPNLANMKVESYSGIGEAKESPMLTQCLSVDVKGKKVLVVDEISDSGKSLKRVTAHVAEQRASEVKTATLYCKPWTTPKPDYCRKKTCCWIVFPWEINESVKLICQSYNSNPAGLKAELTRLSEAGVSKQLISLFAKDFSEDKTC